MSLNELGNTLWIEVRKAQRSRVPLYTLLGFLIMPFAMALFMIVYKDPQFARQIGILNAKAELAAGSAEWPFYLGMYAQAVAIGGILVFSLVHTWVFGREFSDGTLKDLLAVPVPRGAILLAKFMVAALWSLALVAATYGFGLGLGALIGLDLFSSAVLIQGTLRVLFTALMVMAVATPVALFASLGRGYLLPMGMAVLLLALANIVAILGWGDYFPWSVPALFAGMVGNAALAPASYWIVGFTGLAGMAGTYIWWKYSDQSR